MKPAYHLIDSDFMDMIQHGPTHGSQRPERPLCQWRKSDMTAMRLVDAYWATVALWNTDAAIYVGRLELARVLQHGYEFQGYSPQGWRVGLRFSTCWRAAYGHIQSHRSGQLYDPESGLSHLSHALSRIMMLWACQVQSTGTDDRKAVWG